MNTQQRAVIEQALEALEKLYLTEDDEWARDYIHTQATALRQLLEQPEKTNEQVALVIDGVLVKSSLPEKYTGHLYTRPQPATWVGLTDEEIDEADCVQCEYIGMGDYVVDGESVYQFAQAIEAKLKEKNT